MLDLVERADMLVEGMRPGTAERLGLGPDDCLARNPRLVYGRMTGWGQTGPLAQTAGHDLNYIGVTGVLAGLGQDPAPAALPGQPARRLRRRVDVPRHRPPRRPARGPRLRAGPGRRRRDRRRDRPPQRDPGRPGRLGPGRPRAARWDPRRRGPVLRRLRDRRRAAPHRRAAGAAVLRRAGCSTRSDRPARPRRPGLVARGFASCSPRRSGSARRPSGSRCSTAATPASAR